MFEVSLDEEGVMIVLGMYELGAQVCFSCCCCICC